MPFFVSSSLLLQLLIKETYHLITPVYVQSITTHKQYCHVQSNMTHKQYCQTTVPYSNKFSDFLALGY